MAAQKILNILSTDPSLQSSLSQELKISPIIAQVLINRGMDNVKDAYSFLNSRLQDLLDPFSFTDMPKAVSLIRRASSEKEKVIIFSDYDADGITSLALLENTLSKLGLDISHYIPHRVKEGYGLNKKVLDLARRENAGLLITADSGTSSYEEIKELRRLGLEVIVTDHHEPLHKDDLPSASAIINPKVKDSGYKYRDLAGVGVAYKLCQALTGDMLVEELDLVALGTIADSVPLLGENRIIAKEGLERIFHTKRPGLKALIESSRIRGKKITTEYVSFILGPRINASGRVDTAELALSLLMSKNEDDAKGLANEIEICNRQRQKIESVILEEAQDLIDQEINFKEHKVVVVAKEGWHTGVLGIVAAKLSERFYRPTILISLTDELCRGSGRSIKNFHLFQALLECKDLLDSFGGHQHATGLVIPKGNIENFKNRMNHLVNEELTLEHLIPTIDIDMELSLSDLTESFVGELGKLEPFGKGNPEPLFYTRNLKLKGQIRVLSRDTLKFWVSDGKFTYEAIGFGMVDIQSSLKQADCFDIVYLPRMDDWQGESSLILEVKDVFFK
jgi:single-stranded-DNA-specific exonuclease